MKFTVVENEKLKEKQITEEEVNAMLILGFGYMFVLWKVREFRLDTLFTILEEVEG